MTDEEIVQATFDLGVTMPQLVRSYMAKIDDLNRRIDRLNDEHARQMIAMVHAAGGALEVQNGEMFSGMEVVCEKRFDTDTTLYVLHKLPREISGIAYAYAQTT